MTRTTLRRLIVAGVTAGILASTVPAALADPTRPRPPQPITPPGVEETHQDDHATSPRTGSGNKDHSPNF